MTRCRLRKLPLRSAVPSSPMRFTEAGGVNIVDQDLLGCRLAPSDSPVATALCFHQGAIWGGMISPLLVLYATTHQITLAGPIRGLRAPLAPRRFVSWRQSWSPQKLLQPPAKAD